MDDHELGRVLGDSVPPAPASPEAFEAVLARHRRRVRLLVVALVLALVAGPGAGVILARRGFGTSPSQAVETGGDASLALDPATQPDPPSSFDVSAVHSRVDTVNGAPSPSTGAPPLNRLFIRTTDGVTVRAYETDIDAPSASAVPPAPTCPANVTCPPPPPAECRALATPQAEMSTTAAASSSGGTLRQIGSQDPIEVIGGGFFGSREGESVGWIALHASAAAAKVRVRFSDGSTDEMAPANGFAVLARHLPTPSSSVGPPTTAAGGTPEPRLVFPPSPTGSADALDAAGAVISTLSLDGQATMPPQCTPQPIIQKTPATMTFTSTTKPA